MITSLLIITIGLLPLVLALNVISIYKGSELGVALLMYMISITLWQLSIGVLYLHWLLPSEIILQLFRFFRIGPTSFVPITFYIIYLLVSKHAPNIKNTAIYRGFLSIFNKKILWMLIVWSTGIYIMNWTSLGIEGLRTVETKAKSVLLFPVYGDFNFLYLFHTGSIVILVIIIMLLTNGIQNHSLKSFLKSFSLCSMLLFVAGVLNFIPGTGAVLSSFGVIIFTSTIIFSFVRMNNVTTNHYNLLLERQKKLDYLGNVSTSLIHEVKNNLQIIKAYSKLLPESTSLPKESMNMVNMIQLASNQLEELTTSYTDYIHKKSIDFRVVDLNELIDASLHLTNEMTRLKDIDVTFVKNFKNVKAYVSPTYLKQVFINLIKNSSEAIQEDQSDKKIVIETNMIQDKIIIDVSDSGIGIKEYEWEDIFDPFHSSKETGMGIGLPFVRKIMFEHRGEIFVLRSSEAGTTFRCILPQYEFM
ncbi:sensor histidine kinase [Bacillus weihaiensis]|uniref:histidine kinase n=1 Tax=Bacillus weihaiensis TaxID=1547283 RepID=A0A1L3MV32_9BACI|nr:ATP-binding protein [Bacillus weihaiensis]APH06192.1 hypothetical protein A9C19_16380 [Bacillus weihaiensis]